MTERSFSLTRPQGTVPGVLWSPEAQAAVRPPAVLLAHGGSGHKRSDRHVRMAHWLAATAGTAVVAIDGPHHGDRAQPEAGPAGYQQLIVDAGIEVVTDQMTQDWLDTVRALAAQGLLDDARVSVFGLSMGARFGLPVAAALGSRLRCAVFGKFGLRQTDVLHPGLGAPGLALAAAGAIRAPVLFHVQWDDEVFPREGQFELFEAFACDDKRLVARSGRHAQTHPADEASWLEFLASQVMGETMVSSPI